MRGARRCLSGSAACQHRLTPIAKEGLIRALDRCVHTDGNVTPGEFALVQAIAAALHCPLTVAGIAPASNP